MTQLQGAVPPGSTLWRSSLQPMTEQGHKCLTQWGTTQATHYSEIPLSARLRGSLLGLTFTFSFGGPRVYSSLGQEILPGYFAWCNVLSSRQASIGILMESSTLVYGAVMGDLSSLSLSRNRGHSPPCRIWPCSGWSHAIPRSFCAIIGQCGRTRAWPFPKILLGAIFVLELLIGLATTSQEVHCSFEKFFYSILPILLTLKPIQQSKKVLSA